MANSSSTHAPDVRRDTILVVDDTPETLGFLTDTLDHAGFTVLIATDGRVASVRVVSANRATEVATAKTRSAACDAATRPVPVALNGPSVKRTSVAPGYRNVLMSRIETSNSPVAAR